MWRGLRELFVDSNRCSPTHGHRARSVGNGSCVHVRTRRDGTRRVRVAERGLSTQACRSGSGSRASSLPRERLQTCRRQVTTCRCMRTASAKSSSTSSFRSSPPRITQAADSARRFDTSPTKGVRRFAEAYGPSFRPKRLRRGERVDWGQSFTHLRERCALELFELYASHPRLRRCVCTAGSVSSLGGTNTRVAGISGAGPRVPETRHFDCAPIASSGGRERDAAAGCPTQAHARAGTTATVDKVRPRASSRNWLGRRSGNQHCGHRGQAGLRRLHGVRRATAGATGCRDSQRPSRT